MNIWKFIDANPGTTIILAIVIGLTVASCFDSLSNIFKK